MDNSLREALTRIVDASATRDELDNRVIQSYGSGLLGEAHVVAIQRKGQRWLETAPRESSMSGAGTEPTAQTEHNLKETLRRQPSQLVLLGSAALLILVVLFPPYVVRLPAGLSTNAGFAFLFSPPTMGQLVATVNVSLLAIEVLVTVIATAAVFAVARTIERGKRNMRV